VIERDSDVRVGLMLLAAHEARLVEWQPRATQELRRIDLTDVAGDERELRGPSAAHPRGAPAAAAGFHSGQQRDLHEQRLEKHRVAMIVLFAATAGSDAARRGWPLVLVLGDPRLTHPAAREIRRHGVAAEERARILGWLTPAELADAVAGDVGQALERLSVATPDG
jgi:hypothetical protein